MANGHFICRATAGSVGSISRFYEVPNRETEFFDIADVSVGTGTPVRNERTHKAGFCFEHNGPAKWPLIQVEEA